LCQPLALYATAADSLVDVRVVVVVAVAELWKSFSSKCVALFQSGSGEQTSRTVIASPAPQPHKHILKPLWRALQGLLSTEWCRLYCRSWLKRNLFTNIARHNSNAYNRPWIAIALMVKEEQTSIIHRSLAESAERMRSLKSCRGLGWYAFLCEVRPHVALHHPDVQPLEECSTDVLCVCVAFF
jgi:hypothetical protein